MRDNVCTYGKHTLFPGMYVLCSCMAWRSRRRSPDLDLSSTVHFWSSRGVVETSSGLLWTGERRLLFERLYVVMSTEFECRPVLHPEAGV